MHFKLIIALVKDNKTDKVINAAREAGATGTTVISNARGEGLEKSQTFFGLTLETQRDMLLLLVEEHLSRQILETISNVGEFETAPGTGIALCSRFHVSIFNCVTGGSKFSWKSTFVITVSSTSRMTAGGRSRRSGLPGTTVQERSSTKRGRASVAA